MATVIVTGSAGLVGSEAARFFHGKGFDVVGIDNDMRARFFGPQASTAANRERLENELAHYKHESISVCRADKIHEAFSWYGKDVCLVIHAAAQPSHDWAARDVQMDFEVNAYGTLNVLEASRKYCPDAVFIFTSTNKVYGDTPNTLPLVELEDRWEIDPAHPFAAHGIDESMSIDHSKHSLFGASKLAADVLVQEYGRYFGMKTGTFRCGCLTGPAHAGTELHGFLAYLVQCAATGTPYTIHGYKGKQVRDNLHSRDLVEAFWQFFQSPKCGEVYNMGGSRHSSVSVLEAIRLIEELDGGTVEFGVSDKPRSGDHQWYISDVRKFQRDYPAWKYSYTLERTLREMIAVHQ